MLGTRIEYFLCTRVKRIRSIPSGLNYRVLDFYARTWMCIATILPLKRSSTQLVANQTANHLPRAKFNRKCSLKICIWV